MIFVLIQICADLKEKMQLKRWESKKYLTNKKIQMFRNIVVVRIWGKGFDWHESHLTMQKITFILYVWPCTKEYRSDRKRGNFPLMPKIIEDVL